MLIICSKGFQTKATTNQEVVFPCLPIVVPFLSTSEKISWGKLHPDMTMFQIQSDATIVAPLIFEYLLGNCGDKLRYGATKSEILKLYLLK